MADNDELAALKAELGRTQARIAELEARTKPPPAAPTEQDIAKARDELYQLRERQASQIPPWLHAACAGGVTDADAQDLVRASHRPSGPSGMAPSSSQITGVRPGGGPARVPGGGTGWLDPVPLSPPPGVALVDALCVADDVRQRAELQRKLGKG